MKLKVQGGEKRPTDRTVCSLYLWSSCCLSLTMCRAHVLRVDCFQFLLEGVPPRLSRKARGYSSRSTNLAVRIPGTYRDCGPACQGVAGGFGDDPHPAPRNPALDPARPNSYSGPMRPPEAPYRSSTLKSEFINSQTAVGLHPSRSQTRGRQRPGHELHGAAPLLLDSVCTESRLVWSSNRSLWAGPLWGWERGFRHEHRLCPLYLYSLHTHFRVYTWN